MSRWADVDALTEVLEKKWRFTLTDEFANHEVWKALEEVLSIDIVFCRECKKHRTSSCPMFLALKITDADDFCSDAERRSECINL